MKNLTKDELELLRQKAEKLLNVPSPDSGIHHYQPIPQTTDPNSPVQLLSLIHELEVHQVELEMQNEELMNSRAAAREAAEKYTELYDFAPMGYYTLTAEGFIVALNLKGASLLGRERSSLINRRFGLRVSDDTRSIFNHFLETVFTGKSAETCEVTISGNDSQPMHFQLTGNLSQNGDQCHLTAVDITDRVQSDRKVYASEDKYKSVFSSNRDPLFLIDQETSAILDANDAACNLYGYSIGEILRLRNTDMSAEPVMTEQSTRDFRERIEIRYHKKKDGTIFPVDISASLFPLKNRQVILASIRDISERKKAEEELESNTLQLSKLNAEKDKYFSIIAHDLRGPFNAFLGFTQMMVEELDTLTLKEIQQIALSMRTSATNLYTLLENLLEWSKMQRGLTSYNPQSFLLMPKILESMIPVLDPANKKEVRIHYEIPEDLSVYADVRMFGSIIRNLSFNAVKFTSKGGKVVISAKLLPDDMVQLTVKDTGIGMSPEILDKLFFLNDKGNRKGTDGELSTGLGLIICKDLVEKCGGKIWVKSKEAKGSTFSLSLPHNPQTI